MNHTEESLSSPDVPLYVNAFTSTENGEIIVILRGKEMNFFRWMTERVGWGFFDPHGLIDHRFGGLFQAASEGILWKIENEFFKYPKINKVRTVGHGDGGVYAILTALLLLQLNKPDLDVQVYTFGQPRFTNPKLTIHINKVLAGKIFRITHTDDNIPQIPLKKPNVKYSYWHLEREYWISSICDCSTGGANLDENLLSMYIVYECVGKIITGTGLIGVIDENPECNRGHQEDKQLATASSHFGPYFGSIMGICPQNL
ncbi:hypothetical protein G9A89_000845 [Geosiphon pyriformis]|nr:hypothetical protein G9A89_000845 [Geosiphon pyriformis]